MYRKFTVSFSFSDLLMFPRNYCIETENNPRTVLKAYLTIYYICLTSVTRAKPKEEMEFPA